MGDNMVVKLLLSATDRMSGIIRGAATKSNDAFENMQKKMQKVSDGLDKIGKTAMIAGGVIGAPFVFGVKKAADFGAELSNIIALTGASNREMVQLRQLSLKMGADTKYSALEAAQGIAELEKAGVSTAQVLNGGLAGALSLAAAGDIGLADAAEIASTALNAFRADNISVSRAADILAGAANASATGVSELKFSLSSCAAVASGFGMSFMDTNTALAVFAQNGLKGSDAGTSLKSMLMNLQPRTDAQIASFVELGLATGRLVKETKSGKKQYQILSNAFFDSRGQIKGITEISGLLHDKMKHLTSQQRLYALETMFGSDAIRAANILFTEGSSGAQKMAEAISKVTAQEVAFKKMDNLKGSLEQLGGSIETVSISMGEKLVPCIRFITDGVTAATNAFGSMPESIQGVIAITGALSAVSLIGFGALALGASAAVKGYSDFLDFYRTIAPFIAANKISIPDLKFTLSGAPLVAGFDKIKNSFKGFGGVVKTTTAQMILMGKSGALGLVNFFKTLPSNIIKSTKSLYGFVAAQVMAAPAAMASRFQGIGKAIVGLGNPLKAARSAMLAFNLVVSANPIGIVIALIAGGAFLIYKYWKPITAFFRGLWRGIAEATAPLHPAFQRIAQAVKPVFDWFKRLFSPINSAGKASENFGLKIGKAIGGAVTWIAKLLGKVEKLNKIFHPSQWGKAESRVDKELAQKPKVDGSHANGLGNVPYDGYIAELHKGESVLTANENKAIKKGAMTTSTIALTYAPTIHAGANSDLKEIKKLLEEHERKMIQNLKTEQRRREARAYA